MSDDLPSNRRRAPRVPEVWPPLSAHEMVSPQVADLSPREFEVMRCLAAGLSTRDIARRVGSSVKTLDTHRARVIQKIGARNAADLARWAIQHGFVRLDGTLTDVAATDRPADLPEVIGGREDEAD